MAPVNSELKILMKTLFLLRHAKSAHNDLSLTDRSRPLTEEGLKQAKALGKMLAHREIHLDLMISSPAIRTLQTSQLIAEQINYPFQNIVLVERIYNASKDDLLHVLQRCPKDLKHIMLVGHNPGLSNLAQFFSEEIAEMNTCTLVQFKIDIQSWDQIKKIQANQIRLDFYHEA